MEESPVLSHQGITSWSCKSGHQCPIEPQPPNEVMQEEQACCSHPEIDVMAEIRTSQTAIISALRQELNGFSSVLG